ncbi:DoxX family membrane protein [Alkalibacillus aidingensis]|uniref:DoxX family membrane protein n=1 Tax=Alkalibacillus aidingensis TaxID=2747607 RepID=UPI0016603245|nr:DoxX family membrane protein [Alkalibacillus aidingensis]
MFSQFLRTNKVAAGILTFLRLYLGWMWLSAGIGKVMGDFNAGGYLNGALANPVMQEEQLVYPTYVAFIERFALPNTELFSFMVAWGEVLVGLGLMLGILTNMAAFFGVVMNFAFMFAGTISTNPLMVMIAIFILVAGANAGRFGGDRWVLPYLKQALFTKDKNSTVTNKKLNVA